MIQRLLLSILLVSSSGYAFAQRPTDTFRLYFDLNVPVLSQSMEKKIDLLIYNDKIISGSGIMIVGYADYLGSEGYNQGLSMRRAENVKAYLVKYGINPADVQLCVGKGKVDRTGISSRDGFPKDRRVDIVVDNMTRKPEPPAKTKPHKEPEINVDLTDMGDMNKLRAGSTFKLKNVYFPADRHIITEQSYKTLEKLYAVLRDNPGLKISIEGHVCCIAATAPDALDLDTQEPTLSVNRAKEIYNYLIDKGIESDRLRYAGYGKRRPVIANEKNEEEAEKNRRVEIRILENTPKTK